jgi:dihydroflavonol-4-reductase
LPRTADGSPADGTERYAEQPGDTNAYLQCKWAMDDHAFKWAERGSPLIIGIPSMTFGEHDPGASTGRFVWGIAKGIMPRYVRGPRNVVWAGDAGRGLVLALEHGLPGTRYLLAGVNTDMDELTAEIARLAGVEAPRPAPLAMTKFIGRMQAARWRWMGAPPPSITPTAIAVMSAGQHLDPRRSEHIGYRPSLGLTDTLQLSLEWFRKQGRC